MFKVLLAVFCLVFSPVIAVGQVNPAVVEIVELGQGDFVRLVGEVNDVSASQFIQELYTVSAKKTDVTVYIDSPGGDVLSGMRMVDAVAGLRNVRLGLRVTCYVQSAASMAFIFLQTSCDKRIVSSYSILMSHQASLGVRGKAGEVESRLELVRQILTILDRRVAARLGMPLGVYRQTIVNDWWLVGQAALEAKAADRLGSVTCSVELVKAGQCPLVFAGPASHGG